MRSAILLLLLFTVIGHVQAQNPGITDNPTSCDAAFSTNADPLNPMMIHFHDQSTGQITLWQWSFGDGSTSTTQNPVHTYSHGGTYFVCLTVSSSDPGNPCHDVLCIAITIHEPGTCVADYRYTIDPANRLKTYFIDQSSGNINGWHWDFGDGNSSNDRNPSHVFPDYGKFRVCLTAYNIDSISVCDDVKCDSVPIIPAAVCRALFTSGLDSLNHEPNTFKFKNVSAGDPNKFLWKFDDGASYDTRDVIHHFQSPGVHQVCLVIKREEHGEIVCADSLCQTVTTAKYFDLGGHLFAGEFPINNPVSTGDTGVAYLFRIDGSKLIPFDTNRFTHLGYYTFPGKLNGFYVVKAALTEGSRHHAKYFPSYCQGSLTWNEADAINLTDNNVFVSDIHPLATAEALFGPGKISGAVIKANSIDNPEVIPFAEVILFDAQLKPLLYAYSGNSGQFELDNLPYGAYHVYVEFPGKYSRMTAIWLDASTPAADSLLLEVFNHDVTSVHDLSSVSFMAGELFPNPSANEVSLTIDLARATSVKFEIKTMTGLSAWSGTIACNSGPNLVTIPLRSISPGLYLFLIDARDGSPVIVKKLLRY